MILIGALPIWLEMLTQLGHDPDLPNPWAWLSMGSPTTMIARLVGDRRLEAGMTEKGIVWCALLYTFITLISFVVGQNRRRRLPRRAL